MKTLIVLAALCACGCGDSTTTPNPTAADAKVATVDAAPPDALVPASCQPAKIAFTQAAGCMNDGSVEFCIPNETATVTKVTQIASDVNCSTGGGRARCNLTPNQLLCSLPTTFPAHCVTQHAALTQQRWNTVCQLSSLPEVTNIVHTILE
jgi:hypothetical protein